MEQLDIFIKRLAKIGIKVTLFANYPWIYIHTINGKIVTETFEGDHGFTVAFLPVLKQHKLVFTDITEIFKLIKRYK